MQNSLKDLVLEATDIVDLIGERVALKRAGKDFVGLCPFHADHKPSMSVVPRKQIFKCFACGAGGDAIKFVMLSRRVEFREALQVLAQRAGIDLKPQSDADKRATQRRDDLRRALTWARTHFQRNLLENPAGAGALDYARRRGFSDETIRSRFFGFAPDDFGNLLNAGLSAGLSQDDLLAAGLIATSESGRLYDKFRNRLMFPICDGQGRVVAFGGRTLGDDKAKYMNSPETALFSKSRVLFGLDFARNSIEQTREAIVVEGYVDALMLQQAGFENVVATLGTALTDAHVKLLTQSADRVFMCFDGDTAGVKAADRAVEVALQHKLDVRVVVLPDEVDPDELIQTSGSQAFRDLLQSSIRALEFKWTATQKAFSNGGQRGQREALDSFIQFIAKTGSARAIDEAEQGLIIGRIADLLAVPARTVYELLARARSASRRQAIAFDSDAAGEITASYDASIKGLPAGLIAAVEALFGFAVVGGALTPKLEHDLALVAGRCEAWRRMLEFLRNLCDADGCYSPDAVFAALEDAELCDLASRSRARLVGDAIEAGMLEATTERLTKELELLRLEEIRDGMRSRDAAPEAKESGFQALLAAKKGLHGMMAADRLIGAGRK